MIGGYLPKKIYVFLIMMKYDGIYFANRYIFFTGCVEWYFLSKTEIKVFLKKWIYVVLVGDHRYGFYMRQVMAFGNYS